MKKFFFIFLLSVYSTCFAGSRIIPANWQMVTFKVWNPATNGNPIPKSPDDVPEVYMDGHSLYLFDIIENLTVVILDDEDNQIYTTPIPSGSFTVTLPSTLNGDYQLRLIPNDGDIYFYGYIMF